MYIVQGVRPMVFPYNVVIFLNSARPVVRVTSLPARGPAGVQTLTQREMPHTDQTHYSQEQCREYF